MTWLVWRRQRVALLVALGVVVVVGVVLVITRVLVITAATDLGVSACLEPGTAPCEGPAWAGFAERVRYALPVALLLPVLLPGVVGIIAGAGLFGRELERGTHVLALTQSVGRLRWWATSLLAIGLPVAAVMALLTPALAWVRSPVLALYARSPLEAPVFETTGVLPAAYAVLGFVLASIAGLLLRNALAAVVFAVAVQLTLQLVLGLGAREQYLAPAVAGAPGDGAEPGGGFAAVPDGGLTLYSGYLDAAGRQVPTRELTGCSTSTFGECLRSAGVTRTYVAYQPGSRYWPFQGIESGILLVIVAAAVGAGIRELRTRVH